MSYEKVKSVKIENGKVYVTSKCNNDTEPVRTWHCTYLDQFFPDIEQVEINILKGFESGNFQSSSSIDNKYTRALRALYDMPEYALFDWRESDYDKDCPIQAARETKAFDELIKKALNTKVEKSKTVISKDNYGTPLFLYKKTTRKVIWTEDKAKARIFNYLKDAQDLAGCFNTGKEWKFETI